MFKNRNTERLVLMANICKERVVIVANCREDMAEVLEMMARNVVAGPNEEYYFTSEKIDNATGDIEALYSLVYRTDYMNHLCLFAAEPDEVAEWGFVEPLSFVKNHPVFEVEIGLKWAPSELPDEFCANLDPERFGWSCTKDGEAFDYRFLVANKRLVDASEVAEKVAVAKKTEDSAEDLATIAYRLAMSGIDVSDYEPYEEGEE